MDISLKIKTLRLEKKLEQTELANLMGMSSAMISMYELGKQKPSVKSIRKLSEIFEVTPDYFLTEESTKVSSNANNNSISITEKIVEELKNQMDFLRRMLEMESEKNTRLSKTLENLSSNFQEGNSYSSSPIFGETVILKSVA